MMTELSAILQMTETTPGASPSEPIQPSPSGLTSPEDGASSDSLNSLSETATETVTETVTVEPTTQTCAGTSADPCVVDLSDSMHLPVGLWTFLGLLVLLLGALLAAQLRRP